MQGRLGYSERLTNMFLKSTKRIAQFAMLGLNCRQWVTCALICSLVGLMLTLPTGLTVVRGASSENSTIEPVNKKISVFDSLWRNLTAEFETRTISWRPTNVIAYYSSGDEKTKKNTSTKEKSPSPARDGNVSGATKADAAASEKKSEIATSEKLSSNKPVSVPAKPVTAFDLPLPPAESESVYSYQNNLGSPRGRFVLDSPNNAAALDIDHRVGVSNFNFGLSLASLPGRGMDASVGLSYNSRTWNKSCSQYSGTPATCTQNHFIYDVEQSWIAPGFSSGLGYLTSKMVTNVVTFPGAGTGQLFEVRPEGLTDPDGTRHPIDCMSDAWVTVPGTNGGLNFYCTAFETTDGSSIKILRNGTAYGFNLTALNHSTIKFTVLYPNGTQSKFSLPFSSTGEVRRHYPEIINDRNGNVINVAYRSENTGAIDYINDTLNRKINFYYTNDSAHNLVAITIPGPNTNDEIQTVRFYYENTTLQAGGFTSTNTQVTVPTESFKVLKYVYMPATKTGYKYDYNNYFGMIKKITRFVGMTASTTSPSETGSITEGTFAASTEYDYPTTTGVTEVPTYTRRTDSWIGNNGQNNVTEQQITDYTVEEPSSGNGYKNISTITTYDTGFSVVYKTVSDEFGVPEETSTSSVQNSVSTSLSKTKYTWFPGFTNVKSIEVTNDSGLTKASSFEYDTHSNQTVIRECGYAAPGTECTNGTAMRRTEIDYETGTNWIARNLVKLPKSVRKYDGATLAAKTVYEYDNYTDNALENASGAPQHLDSYDPYTTGTHQCNCHWECDGQYSEAPCNGGGGTWVCETCSNYDPNTTYRGNLTKVISFPDTSYTDNDSRNDVVSMQYDITGNLVKETGLSCCGIKTWQFDSTYGYAYPTTETKGDAVTQLTTHASYNFHTGLMTSSTDENNQQTDYQYEDTTLRPKKTIYPNGGFVETKYSDTDPNATSPLPAYKLQKTTLDSTTNTVSSYSYFDARGLGIRGATETPDGWSISAMTYDTLARPKRIYNQFYGPASTTTVPANTKYTEVTLDALGRATNVNLQDNTTVSTYFSKASDIPSGFNKTFVMVTDQAGKMRRQVMDSLGRIVRVDEPAANGSLGALEASIPTQQTYYEYDGNNNLTRVIQSDAVNAQGESGSVTQERKFKYDALSRLIAERQVEANPTLDITNYPTVTPGTANESKWTKVLKYDPHGLLTDGYDARGVHSQFTYDALNRVSTVSYSGETGYQTPPVTYTYDQARSGYFNNGVLTKVTTGATNDAPATKTEFDYDLMGRVVKHRQWVDNQQYDLEYSYNLAGQLTSEKYPDGRIVTNFFDNKGRLSSIADASRTYLSSLEYQGKGGSISSMSFGNGTSETFTLNDRYQMENQTLSKASSVLQRYDYSYGTLNLSTGVVDATKNNGQLAKIDGWIGENQQWSQRFEYDHIGRLSESREYKAGDNSHLTYKQKFDFDRFGNMYRKAASNPTAGQENPLPYTAIEDAHITKSTNRIVSSSQMTQTSYDNAGNVVSDKKFRGLNFTYDANGRTARSTATIEQDPPVINLSVYDAAGMRVAEKVNDVWRILIYDIGGKLVSEYGGPVAMDTGGVKYYMSDWQGSTRVVLNNTGQVKGRADFTAFGEEISSGKGLRTTAQGYGSAQNPRQKYGFTERDSATGLDHTLFRKHENRAGRWTSPDPYRGSMAVGDPQSFNRYSYAASQPTNFVDPSGLWTLICHWSYKLWPDGHITDFKMDCTYFEGGGSNPSTVLGGDASALARESFAAFTKANADCAELAKKLGLDKSVEKEKYILPDEKDLGTKLSDLKFEPGDVGLSKSVFATQTLANIEAGADAVTNPHTQTTFIFQSVVSGGGLDVDAFKLALGEVIFHEAFHINGDDHEKVAKNLGLTYDKKIKDKEGRDKAAADAIDKFIKAGCKKGDAK